VLPTTRRVVASGLVEVHVAEDKKQERGEGRCPLSLGDREGNKTVSDHI